MSRSPWAYGVAGLAALVMATSSTTVCCSSLFALLVPSASCCHESATDTGARSAECECCTADNGQPAALSTLPPVPAPSPAVVTVVELPVAPVVSAAPAASRAWQARSPPLWHRTVVLLI